MSAPRQPRQSYPLLANRDQTINIIGSGTIGPPLPFERPGAVFMRTGNFTRTFLNAKGAPVMYSDTSISSIIIKEEKKVCF